MTTIAYKHPYIAFDGRMCCDRDIITDSSNKMHRFKEGVAFLTGSTSDEADFIKGLEGGALDRQLDTGAFVVIDGAVFYCGVDETNTLWKSPLESQWVRAIGSGQDYAVAAMDHGDSAAEAVAYSATRDVGTGGTIRVFDVETMKEVTE